MRRLVAVLASIALLPLPAFADELPLLVYSRVPVINTTIRGVEEVLHKAGHTVRVYDPAQDKAMLNQMARQIVAGKQKAVISVGSATSATLIAANRGKQPIVFGVALDPSAFGVDAGKPPKNVTGVYDTIDYAAVLALAKSAAPGMKSAGFLLNPTDQSSVACEKGYREAAGRLGIKLVTVSISTPGEMHRGLATLLSASDVLIASGYTFMASADQVVRQAKAAGKPVFADVEDMFKHGAAAGITADYFRLGQEIGKLTLAAMATGTEKNPPRNARTGKAVISRSGMAGFGLRLPATAGATVIQ